MCVAYAMMHQEESFAAGAGRMEEHSGRTEVEEAGGTEGLTENEAEE